MTILPQSLATRLAQPIVPIETHREQLLTTQVEIDRALTQLGHLQVALFAPRYAGWYVANFRGEVVHHIHDANLALYRALGRAP
jgi:hypothetical protein